MLEGAGEKKKKNDCDTLLFVFIPYLINPSKDRHTFILFLKKGKKTFISLDLASFKNIILVIYLHAENLPI